MYFFYFDESGTRDPQVAAVRKDGTAMAKEPLYVLTAVGLFERRWHHFDRAIANLKLEFSDQIARRKGVRFSLADCEVKSVTLRLPERRKADSPFLSELSAADLLRITETYFQQVPAQKMILFSQYLKSGSMD